MNSTTQRRIDQYQSEFRAVLDKIAGVRILVIGDIMLDVYRIGEATRISPEAPVPVLLNPKTEYRLGGAAAVAGMCAALGAEVHLTGMIGQDRHGQILRTIVGPAKVHLLAAMCDRVTTTKERICGIASGRHRQQLGRVDYEDLTEPSHQDQSQIQEIIDTQLQKRPDIVLVSDYGKGFCTPEIISRLSRAKSRTIVDPPKPHAGIAVDFKKYYGVSCIVPNRHESKGLTARKLREHVRTEAAIVKLDQDGCELVHYDAPNRTFFESVLPSRARMVYDVTGAGDQFLAMLGCARSTGADWFTAASLANIAGGLQVERHGCVPVTPEQLLQPASSA